MNISDIQPVGQNVLILPTESATKSTAGLVMEHSSNVSAAPVRGTIVAAGDESKFKKGQSIFYTRYSSFRLTIITPDGEKEFTMVSDDDILAIIKTKK
jgi:co-chaperonin GroES (HSP10)